MLFEKYIYIYTKTQKSCIPKRSFNFKILTHLAKKAMKNSFETENTGMNIVIYFTRNWR
jgi:hypothetical protein